mmetsp:Transcript_31094/g.99385  ORF Transcript_31094/g.99385 Transcript_31094/m.99385 type:complete len:850 (-) Transcript_31094:267-2816(-)
MVGTDARGDALQVGAGIASGGAALGLGAASLGVAGAGEAPPLAAAVPPRAGGGGGGGGGFNFGGGGGGGGSGDVCGGVLDEDEEEEMAEGQALTPLKRCKLLSLQGAVVRLLQTHPDPCYFELVLPAVETVSHLWAPIPSARRAWLSALRPLLSASALGGPPPPLPSPPIRLAALRSHRAKHHARAGYRLAQAATGATVQGDFAHAAGTIRDPDTWQALLAGATAGKPPAPAGGTCGGGSLSAMAEAARPAAGLGGWTPLHVAVAAANEAAVSALLSMHDEDGLRVCRLDAPDTEGVTPLLLAVLCCVCGTPPHPPLASVPPAGAQAAGGAAATSGAAAGHAPAASRDASLDPSMDASMDPSTDASSRHSILLRLLSAGANPAGGCDDMGADSPLLLAIGGRAPAAAAALLRRGADFRRVTADGTGAAALALTQGQHGVLKALLRRGADPNEVVPGAGGAGCKGALLHLAARRGDAAAIRLLLEHGAFPNAPEARGSRPLHLVPPVSEMAGTGTAGGGLATDDAAALSATCAAIEALAAGGARSELPDTSGRCFVDLQPHTAALEAVRRGAALFKSSRSTPRLVAGSRHALAVRASAAAAAGWAADASAELCAACGRPFAEVAGLLDSGKHHCRLLGLLVCDGCSTKRALLRPNEPAVRVCDAAFAMLRTIEEYEHEPVAVQFVAPAAGASPRGDTARAAAGGDSGRRSGGAAGARESCSTFPGHAAPAGRPRAAAGSGHTGGGALSSVMAAAAAARDELLGRPTGGCAAGQPGAGRGAGRAGGKAPAEAHAASASVREAVDALHQRGERLNQLGDKAQRFADDAEDFATTARKLRQQQQKNSGFFGFF